MKYGFPSLNNNLTQQNNNNFSVNSDLNLQKLITVGRVKSIIMDNTHPRFKEAGEYSGLGTIEYDDAVNPLTQPTYPLSKPLFANIKNYPLINEIVYLISFPNTTSNEDLGSSETYYLSTVALWNHPHINVLPFNSNLNNNTPDVNNKNYDQTQVGSVNKLTDQLKEYKFGNTFEEKANIHPLLAFEGDFITEGRWGNSIRLGSTVKNTPNNWSTVGTNGDPIFIIRNGQGNQTDEGWLPVIENINNDDSSIYLTSTQQVPLEASSTKYNSYKTSPDAPNKYSGKQIILNSGRLLLNSTNDHILITSNKTINLNAVSSVNIDTPTTILQSKSVLLGGKNATESILLGDTTINLLVGLVDQLTALTQALTTVMPDAGPAVSPAAIQLISYLTQLKLQLRTITLSKISKTL